MPNIVSTLNSLGMQSKLFRKHFFSYGKTKLTTMQNKGTMNPVKGIQLGAI